MTITYPITLPNKPAPARFSVNLTSNSGMTQSPWSAAQQVQLNTGQLWSFTAEYPPMSDDQARNWWGVLAGLNGRYGTFLFGDPRWKSPRGNWGTTTVVSGASQTGQTLLVSGLPSAGIVRAGDYFQLGSGSASQLYVLTADATAAAGIATLDIWPRLRTSPADATALSVTNTVGVFRLSTPNIARSWEPFRHGLALEMVEALG